MSDSSDRKPMAHSAAEPSRSVLRAEASAATLRDLADRALAGDHGAFEHIHRRVGAGLRRLLLRRSAGREDLVDDLCQKTWTSVWKAFADGKYDPERSAVTTFVYAVGNNAWLTHLRSFARDQGYIAGAPAMLGAEHIDGAADASPFAAPDDAYILAEAIECVRALLREGGPGGLTEHERTVVRAIGAGESDRALARRLNLSSSTVNIRKHAGYAKIRDYLRARGLAGDDWDQQAPTVRAPTLRAPNEVRDSAVEHARRATTTGGDGGGGGGGGAGIGSVLGRHGALAADHGGRLP